MTLIASPTGQFTAYWHPNLNRYFRQLSGYISTLPVKIAGDLLIFDGRVFEHHDLLHYEISLLDRITIGEDWVSGIHGICLPIFPDGPTVPEYDGLLDEARVAMHEWLTQPTLYQYLQTIELVYLVSAAAGESIRGVVSSFSQYSMLLRKCERIGDRADSIRRSPIP